MKIAFLYAGGREIRWEQALAGNAPSDFFYGAVELAKAGSDVVCVDAPENPRGFLAGAYNRLANWRTPVRTRGEHFVAVGAALERLKEADVVVATSTPHANALAMWQGIGRCKSPIVGIHCGLVNHPIAGARLRSTRRVLRRQQIVLFAESERTETVSRFRLDEASVHANAFGVDVDFWTPGGAAGLGGFILAVGNDGRRDYGTLIRAVDGMDRPVKIVTSRQLPAPLPANVTHLHGSWHRPAVSDAELRELYRGAVAVVVPLEDSIQPSGQSVALQAMACGRPVVFTRTRGLWTGNDFHDGEHLLLVEPSSSAELKVAIERLTADPTFAQGMGAAAREAVLERGRMDAFASRLESVIALAHSGANTR